MDIKRILIIEDDTSIVELERDYLEANGFIVDIETIGDKGLARAKTREYDLLIVDVMLPKIDGFEILRQVRDVKDIPILLVSAKKEEVDKIRGLGLGADDYITKPFSPSELVARVKSHLSRYERLKTKDKIHNDEIQIRGLHIDKISRLVLVNEKEIMLTGKEFDLLLFLAANPNRVYTKEELFERIWGIESFGEIATVTVHIRKIREKIEADPSHPQYIETIWGVGYRFKA